MTTRVEESVTVNVPVRTAYNQWTQFEDFPLFMNDVEHVEQIDEKRLHWKAEVRGVSRDWNSEITEQIPDARIAWKSEDGSNNAGVVTFHELEPEVCRIMLQLEFEPEGALEHYADKVGLVTERAKKDLEAFRVFIEDRGRETGAWRGSVGHDEHEGQDATPRYGDRANDVRTGTTNDGHTDTSSQGRTDGTNDVRTPGSPA